jgi:predicted outer membrane repeat protein
MHGGGVYFAASTQFISVISSIFTGNAALEGSGGAMHHTGTCSGISIGGLQPLELSTATAVSTYKTDAEGGIHYAGLVDMSALSGYYVTFDQNSVLDDQLKYDEIKISGTYGLAYQGGTHFSNPSSAAIDDKSNYPGFGSSSPIFVNGPNLTYTMYQLNDQYNFTAYPVPSRQLANSFSWNTASLSGGAIYWDNASTEIFIMPGT